jgi:hypothetical protein
MSLVVLALGAGPARAQIAPYSVFILAGAARPQSTLNSAATARLKPGATLILGARRALYETLALRLDVGLMPTTLSSTTIDNGTRVSQAMVAVSLDYDYLEWRRLSLSLFGGAGIGVIRARGAAPASRITGYFPLGAGARLRLFPHTELMGQGSVVGYRISGFPSGSALGAYGRNQSAFTFTAGVSLGF